MKAEELRIGNFVGIKDTALHYSGTNHKLYFEIEEIRKEVVQFKGFHAGEYFKDLSPIPLTEEILLKCGFEKEFKGCYSDDNRFIIFENIHKNVAGINEYDFYYSKVNGVLHLKHLHQLQNIYYALTGQELQVNITSKEDNPINH